MRKKLELTAAEKAMLRPMGPQGEFKWVPLGTLKKKLRKDPRYQRAVRNYDKVCKKAMEFKWSSFSVLEIGIRPVDSWFLMDGGHRMAMFDVRETPDDTLVPCMFHKSTGVKFEADAFVNISVEREKLTPLQKFTAEAEAGKEPALSVRSWLLGNGFVTTDKASKSADVTYVTTICSLWKSNQKAARKALVLLLELANWNSMRQDHGVFRGLWWLAHAGIDIQSYKMEMIAKAGIRGLMGGISSYQGGKNNRQLGARVAGLGIYSLVESKANLEKLESATGSRKAKRQIENARVVVKKHLVAGDGDEAESLSIAGWRRTLGVYLPSIKDEVTRRRVQAAIKSGNVIKMSAVLACLQKRGIDREYCKERDRVRKMSISTAKSVVGRKLPGLDHALRVEVSDMAVEDPVKALVFLATRKHQARISEVERALLH